MGSVQWWQWSPCTTTARFIRILWARLGRRRSALRMPGGLPSRAVSATVLGVPEGGHLVPTGCRSQRRACIGDDDASAPRARHTGDCDWDSSTERRRLEANSPAGACDYSPRPAGAVACHAVPLASRGEVECPPTKRTNSSAPCGGVLRPRGRADDAAVGAGAGGVAGGDPEPVAGPVGEPGHRVTSAPWTPRR